MVQSDQRQPPVPPFAAHVVQAADAFHLGKPLAEYHLKYTPAQARLRGLLMVGLAFALSVVIIVVIIVAVTQMAQSSSLIIILPIGVALTALALPFRVGKIASANYRRAVELQSKRYYVCTDGIMEVRERQETAAFTVKDALCWDALLSITQRVPAKGRKATVTSYSLQGRNGKILNFSDSFTNFDEFAERVTSSANPYISAQLMRNYEAGQKVTFGPFTVDQQKITARQGMSSRTEALPWQQVAGLRQERNFLILMRTGANGSQPAVWQRVDISTVPNVTVFRSLVEARRVRT